jgi:hypothetical protein
LWLKGYLGDYADENLRKWINKKKKMDDKIKGKNP